MAELNEVAEGEQLPKLNEVPEPKVEVPEPSAVPEPNVEVEAEARPAKTLVVVVVLAKYKTKPRRRAIRRDSSNNVTQRSGQRTSSKQSPGFATRSTHSTLKRLSAAALKFGKYSWHKQQPRGAWAETRTR